MNPYEAMEHPWLSKQRGNEQRESQQQQNVQHFTVKEMNTGDILNKFKLQTEKFNLVNRSAVRFSSFIKTKSSNEEYQSKICAQKVFFCIFQFFLKSSSYTFSDTFCQLDEPFGQRPVRFGLECPMGAFFENNFPLLFFLHFLGSSNAFQKG